MNAAPESVLDIKPGDVLAGKYRVERILGSGGMGMVVAAHHLQLDERVALKFLLPAAVANVEVVARFMREARAAFKIKSEHVARVTDVAQLENGSPYIVMEYLEGGDLAQWLLQRGGMSIAQAVDFVLQACEALAEAHALGIVHRDLKPANLYCVQRADGALSIKVLDFGISKVTNSEQASMTRTNGITGSPLYMSPEHMKAARTVDARTDIWSLGVILFELITGRPPFEAEAVTELVLKVAAEPPIALRRFRPDAPPELEAVIVRALEKDRDRRFQNVAEFAVALLPFGPPHARMSVDRIAGTMERSAAAGGSAVERSSGELVGGKWPAAAPSEESDDGPPTRPEAPVAMPGVPLVAGLMPPSHSSMPMTASSWGQAESVRPTHGKALVGIALGSAVAVAAGVFALAWPRLRPPPEVPAVELAPSAPPPAPSAIESAPIVALPPPTATASPAAPEPAVVSSSATPTASASAPPHPKPNVAPVRNPCNPPYYFDAKGTRHFKRECI
jgi:serine/threonine-protein kinase